VGEYKRASLYCERRIKQIELGRAIEGPYWRKSPFLVDNESMTRKVLMNTYFKLGRLT
jgi:hypothetical protein